MVNVECLDAERSFRVLHDDVMRRVSHTLSELGSAFKPQDSLNSVGVATLRGANSSHATAFENNIFVELHPILLEMLITKV